ncbi:hypothetical protein TrST_g8502 [Triparma strigata]|uniref:Leucine-rich repeat domain, L domain-like n=1 Tax=Triparma strigata TaxID=1606541 RepID=A0A9W7ALB0_9STRA|nr:hypothetical protein TrST_g8502 [Triparma strigata]
MTIPDSLQTVGRYVFIDCFKLDPSTINVDFNHTNYDENDEESEDVVTTQDTETADNNGESQDDAENTPAAEPAASAWIVPPWFHTKEFMRHLIDYLTNDMLMMMRLLCKDWRRVVDKFIDGKVESGEMMVVGGNDISYEEASALWDSGGRSLVTQTVFLLNITKVGRLACCEASILVVVEIPEGVESIGRAAFYNCHSLTTVSFPTTLKSIGRVAFGYCSSLDNVYLLHTKLQELGLEVFFCCSELKSMTIPDSLQTLAAVVFVDFFKLVPSTIIVEFNHIDATTQVIAHLRSLQSP